MAAILMLAGCAIAAQPAKAAFADDVQTGGEMHAEADGKPVLFPLLKTDIAADIEGDAAAVTVVQTFVNPSPAPLNATYLFPLNKDAAVHAMTMEVGNEIVRAKIARKPEAQATFDQAKREGKAAALLQQHRPNMFTQDVANLMPGATIKVTLKYVQTVPRVDGSYEFTVPLIVGPRYMPAGPSPLLAVANTPAKEDVQPPAASQPQPGQWSFGPPPQYPPVKGLNLPATIDEDRVSIRVNIKSGTKISAVSSPTHELAAEGGEHARSITLAKGRTVDNRDFLLRYQLAGSATQAGVLTHRDERGGYFSLMIEPPAEPEPANIVPREMVFVLDTSGSMSGEPVESSKIFMRHALKGLRPSDYFRVIHFSDGPSEMTSGAVPATQRNIEAGLAYVDSLTAGGGTEVLPALRQAFDVRQPDNTLRIVVFLSDGYVGNEAEIFSYMNGRIGKARTYVFGIGTAVNHYLLAEMARIGRGYARFIDPTEKSSEVAIAFAQKLKSPVLTDISIDWGDLKLQDVTPAIIPDLFDGDSIRILGRYDTAGSHIVTLNGLVNGRKASLPLKIEAPQAGQEGSEAIPLQWARSVIADGMRELTTPPELRASGTANPAIEERLTKLGLDYSLVTQWTSFVAVSEKVVNPNPAAAAHSDVPLPMVKGVTELAYPEASQNGAPAIAPQAPSGGITITAFNGSATPEPAATAGLALLCLLLALGALQLRRG
jgi:Ca-activated chloride channel homolog